jgi:hypothetical protein
LVRTPLVDRQIPEQAKELGASEQHVIKHVMPKEMVDGQFTTADDVADAALLFAGARSNADRAVDGGEPRVIHAVAQSRRTRGAKSITGTAAQ